MSFLLLNVLGLFAIFGRSGARLINDEECALIAWLAFSSIVANICELISVTLEDESTTTAPSAWSSVWMKRSQSRLAAPSLGEARSSIPLLGFPFYPQQMGVAVGTIIADRPPHRSVRALLAHTAPT